jgi:hypothetical protein
MSSTSDDSNGGSGVATAAIQVGVGIVSSIFSGMALRSRQAATENQALNQIVQGFDQAIAQLQQAVNSGQLSVADAAAEVNSIWQWYWQSITPKIQPNRNGCASGGNCPGTAIQYAATNGVPAGFCSGNEGASCCVGCGPIRLSIERVVAVLNAGGGTAHVASIGGDKYGLQTRVGYDVTFKPPVYTSITQSVEGSISNLINGGSYSGAVVSSATGLSVSPTVGAPVVPYSTGSSSVLLLGFGAVLLLIIALMFSRK